jgi:predicted GH43/DUF377 family glycosyl hydrolase
MYFNEGDRQEGGIWAIETDNPAVWQYATNLSVGPTIKTRPEKFNQNLVEAASAPFVSELPWWLRAKAGETDGVYVPFHGDSPDGTYQAGWAAVTSDPTKKVLYVSEGSFLRPTHPVEVNDGQVEGVVFLQLMLPASDGKRMHVIWGGGDSVVQHGVADILPVPTTPSGPRCLRYQKPVA